MVNEIQDAVSRWWHISVDWWKRLTTESKIGVLSIVVLGVLTLLGFWLMYLIPRAEKRKAAKDAFLAMAFPIKCGRRGSAASGEIKHER